MAYVYNMFGYPEGTYTLNFLDNHDKNSYEYTITGAFGADALPAMFTLLYTIPGTPLIYTGDEIGLDHNIAFMEKDPVNWENTDVSYRELLAELAAIRADNPALHSGNFGGAIAYYDISRSVFAFSRDNEDYKSFAKMEWVYPYAVFIALKKQNDLRCWNEWPKEQQDWILDRMYDISHLEDEIGYQLFTQFLFYTQWMKLKAYANEKQIQIMGDVPFYVGIDSLDVWSSREDFLLDENWRPSFVAGVPPDYFSVTGQRWGNPIYNWENLERKGFTFWVNRLEYSSKLYDIVRIDHFRAFDTYWKIPASCDTAVEGEWLEAPGYAFFNTLFRQLPDIRIVAEDLGDLRPEVLTLRDRFNLMGMNVAVFSLPYSDSVEEHQLIYTGTHDNQTVKDWYHVMDKKTKKKVRDKLAKFGHPRECINHLMLRYVYESAASMAIVPLADILGLDHHARLNTPGTVGSPNWEWRLENWRSLHRKKALVRALVVESGRALDK